MRNFILMVALCFLVVACNNEAQSNTSKDAADQSFAGYEKAYEGDGFIILRKSDTSSLAFAGNGKRIPDPAADTMIRRYRRNHPNATHYVNFSLDSIIKYLVTFTKPPYDKPPFEEGEFGLRVYFGQDTTSSAITIILSPTYKGRAIWRKGWSKDKVTGGFTEPDEEAMDQGSICPVCITDDEGPQSPLSDSLQKK